MFSAKVDRPSLIPSYAWQGVRKSRSLLGNAPYRLHNILEGGNILLIDKGFGWNRILKAGTGDPHERFTGDPHERLIWKQLPSPGNPGRSENQRQAMLAPPPFYWESKKQPHGPHASGMRGQMGPGMQPTPSMPPRMRPDGMTPQMAHPQMIPANPEKDFFVAIHSSMAGGMGGIGGNGPSPPRHVGRL